MQKGEVYKRMRQWLVHPVALLLLLVPFVKPVSFDYWTAASVLDTVYNVWRVLACGVIGVAYLARRRVTVFAGLVAAYEGALLIPTLLYKGDIKEWAITAGVVLGVSLLAEMTLQEDALAFVTALNRLLAVLVVLNLAFYIAWGGQGLYELTPGVPHYFLGTKNIFTSIYLPFAVSALLRMELQKNYKDWIQWLVLVCASVQPFILHSSTGVLCVLLLAVFIMVVYRRRWQGVCNFAVTLAVNVVAYVSLVLLRVSERTPEMFIRVFGFLGRGATFTGRTYIWTAAAQAIKQHPVLGQGLLRDGIPVHFDIIPPDMQADNIFAHYHNTILQVTATGGTVALVLYLALYLWAGYTLWRNRKNSCAVLLCAGLMLYQLVLIMEVFLHDGLYFALLAMACYVGSIINQQNSGKISDYRPGRLPVRKRDGRAETHA